MATAVPSSGSVEPSDILPFSNRLGVSGLIGEQSLSFNSVIRQYQGLPLGENGGLLGKIDARYSTGTFFRMEDEDLEVDSVDADAGLGGFVSRDVFYLGLIPSFRVIRAETDSFLKDMTTLEPRAQLIARFPTGEAKTNTATFTAGYGFQESDFEDDFEGDSEGIDLQLSILQDLYAWVTQFNGLPIAERKLALQGSVGYVDFGGEVEGPIGSRSLQIDQASEGFFAGGSLLFMDRQHRFYVAPFGTARFTETDSDTGGGSATKYVVGIEGGLDLLRGGLYTREGGLVLSIAPLLEGGNRQQEGFGVVVSLGWYDSQPVWTRIYRMVQPPKDA